MGLCKYYKWYGGSVGTMAELVGRTSVAMDFWIRLCSCLATVGLSLASVKNDDNETEALLNTHWLIIMRRLCECPILHNGMKRRYTNKRHQIIIINCVTTSILSRSALIKNSTHAGSALKSTNWTPWQRSDILAYVRYHKIDGTYI